MGLPRIPPSFFAIPFGLAGLGDVWHQAELPPLRIPQAVPAVIFIATAVVWLALVIAYLSQGLRQIVTDFADPIAGPFVSLAVIVPMLPVADVAHSAFTTARVLVAVFLTLTVVFGGWITGQWIVASLGLDDVHPGYFLPTVAGPFVGAYAASAVGLPGVAQASFGLGVVCWLLLGSIMLNRPFFLPLPPSALIPTLAIEFAPPVVAGVGYFAISGGKVDGIALALGGYAVLMGIVQLRLIPVYAGLEFTPGFWAFTFSYATGATDALIWLRVTRPRGEAGYEIAVIVFITLLIVAITARSAVAIRRGQFFPVRAAAVQTGPDGQDPAA